VAGNYVRIWGSLSLAVLSIVLTVGFLEVGMRLLHRQPIDQYDFTKIGTRLDRIALD